MKEKHLRLAETLKEGRKELAREKEKRKKGREWVNKNFKRNNLQLRAVNVST